MTEFRAKTLTPKIEALPSGGTITIYDQSFAQLDLCADEHALSEDFQLASVCLRTFLRLTVNKEAYPPQIHPISKRKKLI